MQNTIDELTDKVTKINEMISSGDIITTNKITDSDGNIIVTNMGEPIEITQTTP